jgi:hypothetical protein
LHFAPLALNADSQPDANSHGETLFSPRATDKESIMRRKCDFLRRIEIVETVRFSLFAKTCPNTQLPATIGSRAVMIFDGTENSAEGSVAN